MKSTLNSYYSWQEGTSTFSVHDAMLNRLGPDLCTSEKLHASEPMLRMRLIHQESARWTVLPEVGQGATTGTISQKVRQRWPSRPYRRQVALASWIPILWAGGSESRTPRTCSPGVWYGLLREQRRIVRCSRRTRSLPSRGDEQRTRERWQCVRPVVDWTRKGRDHQKAEVGERCACVHATSTHSALIVNVNDLPPEDDTLTRYLQQRSF